MIGFGKIAQTTHLEALHTNGLTVVAVVETHPERQQEAKRLLPHARVYEQLDDLLQHEILDFIDICTPPHVHFVAICKAMIAGVHVLCEKPLVLQAHEGEKLHALAKAHNVVVACIHNWTHAPILQQAQALCHSGQLGALKSLELITLRNQPAQVAGHLDNWRIDPNKSGGGILFDHGWHGMSILLRIAKAQPLTIRSMHAQQLPNPLSVEDSTKTWIDFAHGIKGYFEATWAAKERRNLGQFVCEQATIKVNNDTLQIVKNNQVIHTNIFDESLADGGYRPAWTAGIIHEFIQEINHSTTRGVLLTEALLSLHMIITAYESAKQAGKPLALSKYSSNLKKLSRLDRLEHSA